MKLRLLLVTLISYLVIDPFIVVPPSISGIETDPIIIDLGGGSETLCETEIGYASTEADLPLKLSYKTSKSGTYSLLVSINSHSLTSNELYGNNKTTKTLEFNTLTIKKEWLYPKNNAITIDVVNTLNLVNPVVSSTSLEFDCGYSLYKEVSSSSSSYTSPLCYLAISNGVLTKSAYSYTIKGLAPVIECTNNDLSVTSNTINASFPDSKITGFMSFQGEVRVYNHPDSYVIGKLNYDSTKKQFYNSFSYSSGCALTAGCFKITPSIGNFCYSYANLFGQPYSTHKDNPLYFKSSKLFIPMGFGNTDIPYLVDVIFYNIGPFKDTILLRTEYYPLNDIFGSCYNGDYCVYMGEAR